MAMFILSFGILLGFVIATYFDYYVIPMIALVSPVVYLIAVIYFPETPHFLLRKNKINKARLSYSFYQNIQATQQSKTDSTYNSYQQKGGIDQLESGDSTKEIKNSDVPGFEELMNNVLNKEGTTDKLSRKDFCKLFCLFTVTLCAPRAFQCNRIQKIARFQTRLIKNIKE